MQSKVGGYIGLARRANYLIIGSDNIKSYKKKLYLIIVSKNGGDNILKIAKNKSIEYGIPCIEYNLDLSKVVGIDSCKILGLKNKGLSEEILKNSSEYTLIVS